MNKHWEYDDGIYKLYFRQFYDDELIAELYYDEDEKDWHYTISLYNKREYDWLMLENTNEEFAKCEVEDKLERYMTEELKYMQEMLDMWFEE